MPHINQTNERMMILITLSDAESFKTIAPHILDLFPQGAVAAIVIADHFQWVANARSFATRIFEVGESISPEGVSARAIKFRQVMTDKVAARVYGVRLIIASIPIVEEDRVWEPWPWQFPGSIPWNRPLRILLPFWPKFFPMALLFI